MTGFADRPWFGPQAGALAANVLASRQSPASAVEWIDKLGENRPEVSQAAVGAVARQWAWKNPAETAAWLNQNPGMVNRDQAVIGFLEAQRGQLDKGAAQEWVATIRDETLRAQQAAQWK